MARKKAVVINREALHELDLGMAQGLENLAIEVLDRVVEPDAAPFGVGLVEGGAYLTYVDGKKVGGTATKKPREMKVRGQGVVVGVGYGFPGRFQETGTVDQPARPFFTPVVVEVVGSAAAVEGALRSALSAALSSKGRKLARSAR